MTQCQVLLELLHKYVIIAPVLKLEDVVGLHEMQPRKMSRHIKRVVKVRNDSKLLRTLILKLAYVVGLHEMQPREMSRHIKRVVKVRNDSKLLRTLILKLSGCGGIGRHASLRS